MTLCFRLPRSLYEHVKTDLARPHNMAHERVGFIFANIGSASHDTRLILATEYLPVPDDLYMRPDDPLVGAEISGVAIRLAMQKVYTRHVSAFHVHAHQSMPHFSGIDRHDLPPIIESFGHAHPAGLHGALLLNGSTLQGVAWLPGETKPTQLDRIVVVGYPMSIYEESDYVW
jgi:hypothetical protein